MQDNTPTQLFVYGIFLDEDNRRHYGMTNPEYATVLDFATYGNHIVKAVHSPQEPGLAPRLSLTGLLVDYDPSRWGSLDGLEAMYDRIIVTTTSGRRAFMYAQRSKAYENHSTFKWVRKEATASGR